MADQEPEIVLYDLACTKNGISYRTVFLEFPDIEPTLKGLGIPPPAALATKYTVPAIHHIPSDTYIMDSLPISEFLEKIYPEPAVPLSSELGNEIQVKARAVLGPTFMNSIMPREPGILCERAGVFFRESREAKLGCKLEDLLDEKKEEESWAKIQPALQEVGKLLQTNKCQGPFILGTKPSYQDFFIVGSLQSARVVEESIWERIVSVEGFRKLHGACGLLLERNT